MTAKRSRVAVISAWLGLAGPVIVLLGILGVQVGALSPLAGFGFLPLGLLCGLLALLLGGVGVYLTRSGGAGRDRAWLGCAAGGFMLLAVFMAASPGQGKPAINDITTDLEDPPAFAPAPAGHRNAGRDMSYPKDWVVLVREAYPELAPLRMSTDVPRALGLAVEAGEELGWTITRRDAAAGTFEAEDETALYRFVDDICVRIVELAPGRVELDIRSKSRDGQGDVGANAARIARYYEALRVRLRSEGIIESE